MVFSRDDEQDARGHAFWHDEWEYQEFCQAVADGTSEQAVLLHEELCELWSTYEQRVRGYGSRTDWVPAVGQGRGWGVAWSPVQEITEAAQDTQEGEWEELSDLESDAHG